MTKWKYKKIWFSLATIEIVLFFISAYILINSYLISTNRNNDFYNIFPFFYILSFLYGSFNFYRNYIRKVNVDFPVNSLNKDERILVPSSRHEILTKLGSILAGIRISFLVITNQRMIEATNYFGKWSYKGYSRDYWFNKDNIFVNKKKDSLVINTGTTDLEVVVDDPVGLIEKIKE